MRNEGLFLRFIFGMLFLESFMKITFKLLDLGFDLRFFFILLKKFKEKFHIFIKLKDFINNLPISLDKMSLFLWFFHEFVHLFDWIGSGFALHIQENVVFPVWELFRDHRLCFGDSRWFVYIQLVCFYNFRAFASFWVSWIRRTLGSFLHWIWWPKKYKIIGKT